MVTSELWDKTFDGMYCIHYIPYKERKPHLDAEFKRIKMLDAKNFHWAYTVDSPFYDDVYEKEIALQDREGVPKGSLIVSLEHLRCIKIAYGLGYNRILMMENDVTFIKDLDLIQKYLENIPEDADVIYFDYIFGLSKELDRYQEQKQKKINDYYCDLESLKRIWSAGCYSLSRKGMEYVIKNQEYLICGPEHYLCGSGAKFKMEQKRAFTVEPMAIQRHYDNSLRSAEIDQFHRKYKLMGIDLNNYSDNGAE